MPYLIKSLAVTSLALVLGACSTSNESKRQIVDDERYLNAPLPTKLRSMTGVNLPTPYTDYQIPKPTKEGEVGKALDIRPPLLPLNLLPRSQAHSRDKQAVVMFDDSSIDLITTLATVLQEQQYPIINNSSSEKNSHQWNTDWISWPRYDESTPLAARYQIKATQSGYSNTILITLIDLRQGDKRINTETEQNRYAVIMLNALIEAIDQKQKMKEQTSTDQLANSSLTVQTATDETGLATLIVRAPYTTVWQRLPNALAKIDIRVIESDLSNGQVKIKYKTIPPALLKKLNISEPTLENGNYTVQLGDLGNRTSLQFRTEKGQPINDTDNRTLQPLIQAAFQ